MSWRSSIVIYYYRLAVTVLVVLMSGCAGADDAPSSNTSGDLGSEQKLVDQSEIDMQQLVKFKVPDVVESTEESPLRIQGEYTTVTDRPPFVVRAFVLIPVDKDGGSPPDDGSKPDRKFKRVPFGQLDVLAPVKPGEQFELFPYESADAVRKKVSPGDHILVGMEVVSLTPNGDKQPAKLDVGIKVQRVISW